MVEFKFDCIFYYVSDLDKAIGFYQGKLGFKLTSRDVVARFDVDGVLFELVPTKEHAGTRNDGNGRLCLTVKSVAAALAEFKQLGVSIREAQKKPGGVLGTFRDPDGNEICLWEYATGS